MDKVRNLTDLSSKEIKDFLDSFDTVITDCDGVLWLAKTHIHGSIETLMRLQSLGKKIIFVSNNSIPLVENYCEKIKSFGYSATADQIVIPSLVMSWYLKEMGFDGKAFLVGMKSLRQILSAEGIDVVEPCGDHFEESLERVIGEINKDLDVKAVIMDFDLNLNWMKMLRAINYLKNPDVLYLTGGHDRKLPIGRNNHVLGIGQFIDIVSKECNRTPVSCAKPSKLMKNYVLDKFKIDDPSRCIFIGDSLENDMKFADSCGFSKLWVGTGIDTPKSIADKDPLTTRDRSSIPDYYLPALGHLLGIMDSFHL